MEFRPYIGARTIEHFGDDGRPHTRMTYGSDRSGTVEYSFNELGFRGPVADPNAKRTIYVCGCSHTFGTGNTLANTWPIPFARRYAAHLELQPDDVAVMNFAEGGTSNRYISRTLIDQCRIHPPDLAIAHFSEVGRTEYPFTPGMYSGPMVTEDSKAVAHIGPWQNASWLKRQFWLLRDFRGIERPAAKEILSWSRSYYTRTYRARRAAYETLVDMLLFQFFCQSAGVDFLMCCVDYPKLVKELDNSAVRILWEMLDHQRLVDFAVSDDATRLDTAADGQHPGQNSHDAFAEKLFSSYLEGQSSSKASL